MYPNQNHQNTTVAYPPNHQNPHTTTNEDDESFLLAMQVVNTLTFPMVMQAIIELDVLEIIAREGQGAQLSPSQIASHLPTKNPEAPMMLDRLMRLLACHNMLTCSVVTLESGKAERMYGLAPLCKFFVKDGNAISLAPFIKWMHHKDLMQSWYHLKDAVLEGGVPFDMAYGMDVFQYLGEKAELHELFNRMQFIHTTTVTNKILETYKGFHGLKEVVDVGGGLGVMIDSITTKYPTIQGINFDLPQVIEHAPRYQGVEHIGGDMFISIPKGETIFMKFVLHDWNDEQCLILLKNCYKALPNHGKVIVVEIIAPVIPRDNATSRVPCQEDIIMMAQAPGGKERTEEEFEALALGAGFVGIKLVCSVCYYWVMEFHK